MGGADELTWKSRSGAEHWAATALCGGSLSLITRGLQQPNKVADSLAEF